MFSYLCFQLSGLPKSCKNPEFSKVSDAKPDSWTLRVKQTVTSDKEGVHHPDKESALHVQITKDGGSSYGEILQKVEVDPEGIYRFSGDLRSTKGGTAFFQIKRLSGKKELERIALPFSEQSWQRIGKSFSADGADHVEILCRFRQKKAYVGEHCWFTNLSLAKADALADPSAEKISEPIPAPPKPPKVVVAEVPLLKEHPGLLVAKPGTDQYVTPAGAGARTGADWENARAATDGGLQAALDATGPGNTLRIGSGDYPGALLELTAAGSGPDAMLNILGVDTGGGLPVLRGRLVLEKDRLKDGWETVLRARTDTGWFSIRDLRFENVSCAIKLHGRHLGVRMSGIEVEKAREGFMIYGMEKPGGNYATNDVEISDCSIKLYTKRAVRIEDGVHNVSLTRIHADAGGEKNALEAFPIGFHIFSREGTPGCKDIRHTDCSARGNWNPEGDKYWNGDGFSTENRCTGIVYTRCFAADNTDGGWDVKSEDPVLIDCVAIGNKRNFRFWSRPGPATLRNCVSAFPMTHKKVPPARIFGSLMEPPPICHAALSTVRDSR